MTVSYTHLDVYKRQLLVRFWTDSDHVPDTDRRSGSYNNSNSRIYIIRKKNIDHAATVSYTHLDVYKRQSLIRRLSLHNSPSRVFKTETL